MKMKSVCFPRSDPNQTWPLSMPGDINRHAKDTLKTVAYLPFTGGGGVCHMPLHSKLVGPVGVVPTTELLPPPAFWSSFEG